MKRCTDPTSSLLMMPAFLKSGGHRSSVHVEASLRLMPADGVTPHSHPLNPSRLGPGWPVHGGIQRASPVSRLSSQPHTLSIYSSHSARVKTSGTTALQMQMGSVIMCV